MNSVHSGTTPQATALHWMPIDTAPKDGTLVLVYCPHPDPSDGPIIAARWMNFGAYLGECWLDSGSSQIEDPTHWMPLPEPPK